jgi:capsular exopolysaccharide synthesis family protein
MSVDPFDLPRPPGQMSRQRPESAPARVRPLRRAQFPQQERRLDLQETLSILWYRKWSILIVTLLTVGASLLVSSRQTPIYESQASVLVTPIETGNETVPIEEPNMATEAELVTSATVARIVADNLGVAGPATVLLDNVAVQQPADTEILQIGYRDPDPTKARRLAAGFAEGYLEFREAAALKEIEVRAQELDAEIAALERRLKDIDRKLRGIPAGDPRRSSLDTEAGQLRDQRLQAQLARLGLPQQVTGGRVIQPASSPMSPVSPNHVVNGLLGLIIGLALGVGQALMRDRLSGRLRSSEEVEAYLEAPVLAVIPGIPEWRRRKQAYLVSQSRRESPVSEAYRILRTNLMSAATIGIKSVVVTSAHGGEGKSATVANLGLVLARAGKNVSLVSADLRRPRLHEFFRGSQEPGLSEVLAGGITLNGALRPFSSAMNPSIAMRMLSSGRVPGDPAELLSSAAMANVLNELEVMSDFVLIDVPPILPVTDALVVARLADAVLLVIGPNSSTRATVTSARQQLDRVDARILGCVLNGPHAIKARSFGYY